MQLFSETALSSRISACCRADFIRFGAFSSIECAAVADCSLIGDTSASRFQNTRRVISRARHFKLPGIRSRARARQSRQCCAAACRRGLAIPAASGTPRNGASRAVEILDQRCRANHSLKRKNNHLLNLKYIERPLNIGFCCRAGAEPNLLDSGSVDERESTG